jgi:uncharacterized membrane protein
VIRLPPNPVTAAAGLTALAVVWAVALGTAPALATQADRPVPAVLAAGVYSVGAVVCHQAPVRSFHLDGVRVPVCARCTGLYLGAAAGMLGWWGARRSRIGRRLLASPVRVLAVVAVPTAVTWAAASLGFWDPGNVVRAVAALPLGAVAGSLVTATVSGELR